MTIDKKFILVFSIFLVAVLIGAFFVFKTTREQQSDLVVVNLAASAEETASASEELAAQAQTMKEQINLLAIQVGGKGNGVQRKQKPANTDKNNAGNTDNGTSSQVPGQDITDPKAPGKSILNLISSPIYILKSIIKRKKSDDFKSESVGSPETTPDADNKSGDNGNGKKEDVLIKTAPNDSMIPMGENRITEHDENFKDF